MPPNNPSPLFVPRADGIARDPPPTVVWVRGEHDASTCMQLSATFAKAVDLSDADIVVDFSGVTFMDASTISAVVVVHKRLRVLSRCLSVRSPSPQARRLLDLCGLARLIDEHPTSAQPHKATSLGSWVEVPGRDRAPDPAVARMATSGESP